MVYVTLKRSDGNIVIELSWVPNSAAVSLVPVLQQPCFKPYQAGKPF